MKILILGAGQVGSSVAAALSVEDENQITVVDRDANRLRELTEKLDIRTVTGHASLPSVLSQAGIDEADLLVAVTSSDEVNIIACQIAAQQADAPTRVARLREQEYLMLAKQGLGGEAAVTAAISPGSTLGLMQSRSAAIGLESTSRASPPPKRVACARGTKLQVIASA